MKGKSRYLLTFVLALTIVFVSTTCHAAASVIKINGVVAEIPADMGKILEKDDRTFVPIRFVSEFLKNGVWYMDNERAAIIDSSDSVILTQDGNSVLFITKKESSETLNIQMDTSAFISPDDARMYLPIRFLAEAIGYTVGWDEATQTVTLDMVQ